MLYGLFTVLQGQPSTKPETSTYSEMEKRKDMPMKMGATVLSVVIVDSVYIGGGDADNF